MDLPCEAIEDNIIDSRRWSEVHEIVFKDKDGKHYEAGYSCGSTEMQEESPWEYEEEVEAWEVEQKEVTVKKWVRKKG